MHISGKFIQISIASAENEYDSLYGLTNTGNVYRFDFIRNGWEILPMKVLEETE